MALNEKITIMSKSMTQDAFGDMPHTSTVLAQIWAKVRFVNADTSIINNRPTAKSIIQFEIRYRDDVSVSNTIVYQGKSYSIESIEQRGRKYLLLINAKSVE